MLIPQTHWGRMLVSSSLTACTTLQTLLYDETEDTFHMRCHAQLICMPRVLPRTESHERRLLRADAKAKIVKELCHTLLPTVSELITNLASIRHQVTILLGTRTIHQELICLGECAQRTVRHAPKRTTNTPMLSTPLKHTWCPKQYLRQ